MLKIALKVCSYALAPILSALLLSTHAYSDEIPHPNLETDQADDALASFQRSILESRHRRNTTPEVTMENVATYPLPGAAIVQQRVTGNIPIPMSYILNHSVNVPRNAEAGSISVQKGTIVFSP